MRFSCTVRTCLIMSLAFPNAATQCVVDTKATYVAHLDYTGCLPRTHSDTGRPSTVTGHDGKSKAAKSQVGPGRCPF